jgi:hypothetical protein
MAKTFNARKKIAATLKLDLQMQKEISYLLMEISHKQEQFNVQFQNIQLLKL